MAEMIELPVTPFQILRRIYDKITGNIALSLALDISLMSARWLRFVNAEMKGEGNANVM